MERPTHLPRAVFFSLLKVSVVLACLALFALVSTLLYHPASAATTTPTTMNFQGRLLDSTGTPMPDGLYNMQFRLFTVVSGGSSVWNETRETTNRVQVTGGLFSTQLGQVSPLSASLFASGSLYFEITLPTPATSTCSTASCASWEAAMTPRNLLATSAYAYNAETLDGIDGASLAQLASNNAFTGTNSINVSNTSAFSVVSGATNLFKVNTSGSQVVVGASDTTGAVLVLDVKTDAGDPSGTIGAMYYNSNAGKFRCYQVSAWVDCIAAGGSATPQNIYDNDSSGVADITTSSAAKTFLYKAGATFDAAKLFDVQDAGGTSLFVVDSSNKRVYIGNPTAENVGALLVLDTKNGTGDPTGVDGAMYYNSDSKNFRCYKNGLWQDCNFASLRSEWMLQEEWRNANATIASTNTMGDNNWTSASIGTGGTLTRVNVGTDASNRDRWGVMQMNSPATVNTGAHIRQEQIGMTGVPTNMTVEFDFAPVNAAAAAGLQQHARIGLHDATNNTTAPVDGIYFQYSATTAAANWFRCTRNANTETCTDTGVARTLTANQYQRFKFVTNSAGTSVEFFINEASVGSNTTNLPAAAAAYGPAINVYTVDATIRQWKTDYYQIKRNLTTLR